MLNFHLLLENSRDAKALLKKVRAIFRFQTFCNEVCWTCTIQFHKHGAGKPWSRGSFTARVPIDIAARWVHGLRARIEITGSPSSPGGERRAKCKQCNRREFNEAHARHASGVHHPRRGVQFALARFGCPRGLPDLRAVVEIYSETAL
jgi:hypothetical protein